MVSTGLHYGMSDETYHGDPCDSPSLSSSLAHTIVSKSALHAWAEHPRLGNCAKREVTDSLDRGAVLHALLLGAGDAFVVIRAPEGEGPYTDFRKKAAREARDEARAAGKVPLLQHHVDGLDRIAERLRRRLAGRGVRFVGASEVAAVWEDEGVLCRARFDHLLLGDGVIYDLKIVTSAHPTAIQAHMAGYGYDIQATAYRRALATLEPRLAGRVQFRFVFCEPQEPYEIVIAEPSGSMDQLGEMRWTRARDTWRECLQTDKWPGYATDLVRVEAKPWMLEAEMTATYGEDYRL